MYITMFYRTIILYLIIVVCFRVMGKKEVGELSVVDLVVTILIADITAISIENYNKSILVSIIPMLSLVFLQIILSYISLKNTKIRNMLDGKPSMIIKKGKVMFSEMTKIRYSITDLISQLREKGVKSIEDVDYAVLENSGNLSVFQKEKEYPFPIIIDGVIDYDVLKEIGKDTIWIHKLLIKKDLKLDDVFYAFYTKEKTFIIKKSDLI